MRREISLLLVLATILTFSTIRASLGEETKKPGFLELASGKWKLESINMDGTQLGPNSTYKNATAVVNGNVLTFQTGAGDFVLELEEIDDAKDPVELTVVRRKEGKVRGSTKALAKIKDDRFVLCDSLKKRPTSIEPGKGNVVRVWVRDKTK